MPIETKIALVQYPQPAIMNSYDVSIESVMADLIMGDLLPVVILNFAWTV